MPMPGPAYQMVKLVWDNRPGRDKYSRRPKSWRRLNAALQKALDAAIEVGMRFELGDVAACYGDFCGAYWFGSPAGDHFYCIAVEADNISACRSIEHALQRKPFMWQGKRLAYGSTFLWPSDRPEPLCAGTITETVRVTSLHDTHLIACAYEQAWVGDYNGGGHPEANLKRRYTITRKQLRAAQRKGKG